METRIRKASKLTEEWAEIKKELLQRKTSLVADDEGVVGLLLPLPKNGAAGLNRNELIDVAGNLVFEAQRKR